MPPRLPLVGPTNTGYVGHINIGHANTGGRDYALAAGAVFAAASAVIALATKNAHEDPAHQAAEAEGGRPPSAASLATSLENR